MEENNKEVNITYETLFEMLRREKDKEELQKLSSSFFADVIVYLEDKKKSLNDMTLQSFEDKRKFEDEVENIRRILKDLYERREKKIVNLALNISRTKSNLIDTSSLLNEEKSLFDSLIRNLDYGRESILNMLLKSKSPEFRQPKVEEPKPATEENKEVSETQGVSDDAQKAPLSDKPTEQSSPEQQPSPEITTPVPSIKEEQSHPESQDSPTPEQPKQEVKEEKSTKMIRFTNAVPKFVGKELEEYGPFDQEDVANLPAEIAKVLIEKGRAEEIEEQ
ncbi:hypothetical protein ACFLZ6_00535 [Nanoarchaeota archaeon]